MIEYRTANPEDSAGLLLHLRTVGAETDNLTFGNEGFQISSEREARFINRFVKNEDEIMLVAMDGDIVVANAVIERERISRLSHRARLTLTVMKDYWGQGIGTRLMEMMVDFCISTGVKVITLECRADNSRAIRLYEKFGFTVMGRLENYFRINEKYHAALIMEKYL